MSKVPEWRWQRRRADLRHFEIIRHGPVIIYTRLPAGGTHYPICEFPASSECLIGISDAFMPFVYGYTSSSPRAHCTPNKSATLPAGTYNYIQVHARRLLTSAVPWISDDRLGELLLRETSSGYSSNCDEAMFGVQKASHNMFWNIRPVRRTLPLIG